LFFISIYYWLDIFKPTPFNFYAMKAVKALPQSIWIWIEVPGLD